MGGPFKMRGFSGFGDSPLRQEKQFGIGDSTDVSGKPVINPYTGKQTLTKEQRKAHKRVMAKEGSGTRALYVDKAGPKIPSKVKNYKGKIESEIKKSKALKSAAAAASKLRGFGRGPKGY